MLDLKAQLEAAGIVTAEQVKAFDEKEAKAKAARKAKAEQRKSGKGKPRTNGQGKRGPHKGGSHKGGPHKGGSHKGGSHKGRGKGPGRSSVEELKAMGKGEAYDRIRKIVAHSRLDDKERTIPLPDDQTFNFVTASGSIGRLYLNAETVAALREGKAAISSFMSNHGLSHCVLPKDIALDLAKVFPLWLRHLRGREPIVQEPEEAASKTNTEAKGESKAGDVQDGDASESPKPVQAAEEAQAAAETAPAEAAEAPAEAAETAPAEAAETGA